MGAAMRVIFLQNRLIPAHGSFAKDQEWSDCPGQLAQQLALQKVVRILPDKPKTKPRKPKETESEE